MENQPMGQELDRSVHLRFSSRLAFLLSVIGIAVGTGNIWRFPRIAARNGSDYGAGAFLVAWIVCLFLWSVPLVLAEYALGRRFRRGVVETLARTAGPRFAWMGAGMAFVTAAITCFYAVVVGWCLSYLVVMIRKPLPQNAETALLRWSDYQNSLWPLAAQALVMGLGGLAISRGIRSIERINRILIPTLLGIVVLALVRGLTLPGAGQGVSYLFTPTWSQLLHPKLWMETLTQNAWDVGAGWGLYLTYATYLRRRDGVVKNAFITPVANNLVSLLAALMIFATAFAVLGMNNQYHQPEILKIMRESGHAGTGLTFVWMPQLFARMWGGRALAILFFLGLTFAGFSSLIAHLELIVRTLIDRGHPRTWAILLCTSIIFLCGIPSALSDRVLQNQDFVWGYALILTGGFVAWSVRRYGAARLRTEELSDHQHDRPLGRWWDGIIGGFVPLAAVTLLIGWLALEAKTGNAGGVVNCLVQWALALALLLACNRWLAGNIKNER